MIPVFDEYPFTDENNFAGLRWVMKMGIDLQSITLSLRQEHMLSLPVNEEEGYRQVATPNKVLFTLVDGKVPDIAALYAEKSSAVSPTALK